MLEERILLKEGVKFEYVSGSNSGTYRVTHVKPNFGINYGIAITRRITDNNTVIIRCSNDGYYIGFTPLFLADVIKPSKYIKKFRL